MLSLERPRTPCGASRRCRRRSRVPASSSTRSTSWLIETSSALPRLIGSTGGPSMIIWTPSTQSSTYMKLRVWKPSPQISISSEPPRTASATLRQIAAGAFSRPPRKVPNGP